MEQHDFLQHDEAWHKHRATHFNASDAPAMLGICPYKTRTQLLDEKLTGITPEIDEATQARFDDGHRFEKLARPLAEKIIGKALYPVVGSLGKLSASFDGLKSDDSICFEHKTLNVDISYSIKIEGDLPSRYRAQMEQQLLVSGARECLFMASKWDADDVIDEEVHTVYISDPGLRQRIIAGWQQFAIDLESHIPQMIAEKPVSDISTAEVALPALFVHARGEITEHNMREFGEALSTRLAETRALVLTTDQDFSNAKHYAKIFRESAKKISESKAAMLAQTESIGEAVRKIDGWVADLNRTALQLEKDVDREDKAKKEQFILRAKSEYSAHISSLEMNMYPIRLELPAPNFAETIKGKRTYTSMIDAIETMLSQHKSSAAEQAADRVGKIGWMHSNAKGRDILFPDLQQIIGKPMDDFMLLIKSRIGRADAEEKERAQQVAPVPAHVPVVPVTEELVPSRDQLIRRFMASREWKKGEANKVIAILVEFIKFAGEKNEKI